MQKIDLESLIFAIFERSEEVGKSFFVEKNMTIPIFGSKSVIILLDSKIHDVSGQAIVYPAG